MFASAFTLLFCLFTVANANPGRTGYTFPEKPAKQVFEALRQIFFTKDTKCNGQQVSVYSFHGQFLNDPQIRPLKRLTMSNKNSELEVDFSDCVKNSWNLSDITGGGDLDDVMQQPELNTPVQYAIVPHSRACADEVARVLEEKFEATKTPYRDVEKCGHNGLPTGEIHSSVWYAMILRAFVAHVFDFSNRIQNTTAVILDCSSTFLFPLKYTFDSEGFQIKKN